MLARRIATLLLLLVACVLPVQAQDEWFGEPHVNFWDKHTFVGIAVVGSARAAEGYVTCRDLNDPPGNYAFMGLVRNCRTEVWANVGVVGGSIGLSYLLHRKGHHTLERVVPYAVATQSAVTVGLKIRW